MNLADEEVEPWDAGLKVYYVNTVGLTNKNINQYLKLLTDKTSVSKNYRMTSNIKELIYAKGDINMSSEMRKWINEVREDGIKEGKKEGKLELALSMFKMKLIELKDAAKLLGMSERQFMKLAK